MLRGDVEPHSNDVRKRKMTLKLHSGTPSLLQDSTSLPATAESGIMPTRLTLLEGHKGTGQKMVNDRAKIAFLLVLLGCLLSACAQIKEAGRTIGHTTRDVTREIGHGTRDAAKAVGEGIKKVMKSATDDEG